MKHLRKFNEISSGYFRPTEDFPGKSESDDILNQDISSLSKDMGKDDSQKWAIFAGLGGGFGGANFKREFEGSKEDAEREAYQDACDEYDTYDGMHGLRSTSDIMDEDDVDEQEAEEIWNEEREGWLDYYVEPYEEGKDYE